MAAPSGTPMAAAQPPWTWPLRPGDWLAHGAAVNVEGGYCSAGVNAGRLNRWRPDGTLSRVVTLPVRWPTLPFFGAGPGDGRLLAFDTGIAGAPVGRFADRSGPIALAELGDLGPRRRCS